MLEDIFAQYAFWLILSVAWFLYVTLVGGGVLKKAFADQTHRSPVLWLKAASLLAFVLAFSISFAIQSIAFWIELLPPSLWLTPVGAWMASVMMPPTAISIPMMLALVAHSAVLLTFGRELIDWPFGALRAKWPPIVKDRKP